MIFPYCLLRTSKAKDENGEPYVEDLDEALRLNRFLCLGQLLK